MIDDSIRLIGKRLEGVASYPVLSPNRFLVRRVFGSSTKPHLPALVLLVASTLSGTPGIAATQERAGLRQPTLPAAVASTQLLTADGFSNVAVLHGRRLWVTFENTRYRDSRRALDEAAALLLPTLADGSELVLVPTVDGVMLGQATYAAPDDGGSPGPHVPAPALSLSLAGMPADLVSAPRAGKPFGRVDVVVHPWFEAAFGDFDNPIRSRSGVAPEVRVPLRTGLSLSAQVLFTVQDDLPTGESSIRPGLVTLTQTVRLPRNVFVVAAAGLFARNRYGADLQARAYSSDTRWFAGGELALTGAASFAREGWSAAQARERTALAEAGWRSTRYGLTVQGTAGTFLGEQKGIRMDVVRQFGEVDLGWFVTHTDQGTNAGATLRIPLGVAKHPQPGPLRVRVADAFRWEYRYYGFVPGGRRFRTGRTMDDFARW